MSTPVVEVIAYEIMRRLRNIKKTNGYLFDVGEVAKPRRDSGEWTPEPLDIYIEMPEAEENEEQSCPGSFFKQAWNQPFAIHGFSRQLERDESQEGVTPLSVSESVMSAAIRKAITNDDPSHWHSFCGYARNARFLTDEQFDEPGFDGATLNLLVTYRVSELDPAVVA